MKFQGSVIKEQGVTFAIAIVKRHVLNICHKLSPESKEVTLIHEMLHAMNSTMNHEFVDSLADKFTKP